MVSFLSDCIFCCFHCLCCRFLLVNTDERKCLSSVHPSGVMTGVDSQSNLTGTIYTQNYIVVKVIWLHNSYVIEVQFKLSLFCIVLLKLNWCLTSHLSFRFILNHTICKSWKSCVILFLFPGGGMSIAKRKSILVSFYKSVVGTLFPPHELAASLTGTPVAYTPLETDQGFKSKLEVCKCHTQLISTQFNLLYANIIRNVYCLN